MPGKCRRGPPTNDTSGSGIPRSNASRRAARSRTGLAMPSGRPVALGTERRLGRGGREDMTRFATNPKGMVSASADGGESLRDAAHDRADEDAGGGDLRRTGTWTRWRAENIRCGAHARRRWRGLGQRHRDSGREGRLGPRPAARVSRPRRPRARPAAERQRPPSDDTCDPSAPAWTGPGMLRRCARR